jgi:hypothetical protein
MKVGAATERAEVSAQGGLLRLLSCATISIIGMDRQKGGEEHVLSVDKILKLINAAFAPTPSC